MSAITKRKCDFPLFGDYVKKVLTWTKDPTMFQVLDSLYEMQLDSIHDSDCEALHEIKLGSASLTYKTVLGLCEVEVDL
jgi:hypothetical protein